MEQKVFEYINNVTLSDALSQIVSLTAESNTMRYVLVANINHLAKIRTSSLLQHVYKQANLIVPDGRYVYWLSKLSYTPLKEYIRGQELFYGICQKSHENKLRVMLVGGKPGALEITAQVLNKRYPNMNIMETMYYPLGSIQTHGKLNKHVIEGIKHSDIDLLILGIGTPREQEWIETYKNEVSCLIIGHGSAFDFTANLVSEAPRTFQILGLEWFWRFVDEPGRLWKRYFVENMFIIPVLLKRILSDKIVFLVRGLKGKL